MNDRPNILWICTDQQRYDTIGALGNAHIHTPNIDRLVGEGFAFTHAYCQSPICTPSRASFLTGMYPSSVHACMNGNDHWADAAPLVTKLLADAGYDCGLAGKLHLAGAADRIEPRPDDGYRIFHWSHHPSDEWDEGHDYVDWLRAQGEDPMTLFAAPAAIPPHLHQTTWCTDRALDFISEERSQPWLMSVNYFDPHAAFDPPQLYLDRYDPAELPPPIFSEGDLAAQAKLSDIIFQTQPTAPENMRMEDYFDSRFLETVGLAEESGRRPTTAQAIKAAYYAMIELIDDNVGRLLEELERTGQCRNTLVIFMSDHGEMMGDHGLVLKGCRFYEGLVRVPLIMRWPGQIVEGIQSDALVELTDIAPTLLDFCDVEIPERMQGKSLRPILVGEGDPHHHRNSVRTEYYRTLSYLERHVIQQGGQGSFGTMIRDEQYKLVTYHGHEVGELYDLINDPSEFNNLWADPTYTDIRFRLMKQSFDSLAFAVDRGPEQVTRF